MAQGPHEDTFGCSRWLIIMFCIALLCRHFLDAFIFAWSRAASWQITVTSLTCRFQLKEDDLFRRVMGQRLLSRYVVSRHSSSSSCKPTFGIWRLRWPGKCAELRWSVVAKDEKRDGGTKSQEFRNGLWFYVTLFVYSLFVHVSSIYLLLSICMDLCKKESLVRTKLQGAFRVEQTFGPAWHHLRGAQGDDVANTVSWQLCHVFIFFNDNRKPKSGG